MEEFIKIMKDEYPFMSENMIRELLLHFEEIKIAAKEHLISYDKVNTNVYISKSGITRFYYFDGDKEITYGFTAPATFILSPRSFFMNELPFLCVEACTECMFLKIDRNGFDSLLKEYHELAYGFFNIGIGQLCACEHKMSLINGSAKEKYLSLVKNRPDIIQNVSMKIIASYLGVTPQYLCRIKRELL